MPAGQCVPLSLPAGSVPLLASDLLEDAISSARLASLPTATELLQQRLNASGSKDAASSAPRKRMRLTSKTKATRADSDVEEAERSSLPLSSTVTVADRCSSRDPRREWEFRVTTLARQLRADVTLPAEYLAESSCAALLPAAHCCFKGCKWHVPSSFVKAVNDGLCRAAADGQCEEAETRRQERQGLSTKPPTTESLAPLEKAIRAASQDGGHSAQEVDALLLEVKNLESSQWKQPLHKMAGHALVGIFSERMYMRHIARSSVRQWTHFLLKSFAPR